jgi:hypothetical protein
MAHSTPNTVFILHHVHEKTSGEEDIKLIGVYSSRSKAEEAIVLLSLRPGFQETRHGFEIDEYRLDQDHWADGFLNK